jgi:hypothetical protein
LNLAQNPGETAISEDNGAESEAVRAGIVAMVKVSGGGTTP